VKGDREGQEEGLFDYLDTIWKLEPLGGGNSGGRERTRVELQVQFRFQNPIHAAMMSAAEDQVAGMMIEAFEKRVEEVEEVKDLR
jgi:coenzyme Q-binding protein COQ10